MRKRELHEFILGFIVIREKCLQRIRWHYSISNTHTQTTKERERKRRSQNKKPGNEEKKRITATSDETPNSFQLQHIWICDLIVIDILVIVLILCVINTTRKWKCSCQKIRKKSNCSTHTGPPQKRSIKLGMLLLGVRNSTVSTASATDFAKRNKANDVRRDRQHTKRMK